MGAPARRSRQISWWAYSVRRLIVRGSRGARWQLRQTVLQPPAFALRQAVGFGLLSGDTGWLSLGEYDNARVALGADIGADIGTDRLRQGSARRCRPTRTAGPKGDAG